VQLPAPFKLYVPTPQAFAVALVLPAGQKNPAPQLPLQAAVAAPAAPHVPAGHKAVHAEEFRPVWEPYVPAGQAKHDPAPPVL
jgi:hypothetical protein